MLHVTISSGRSVRGLDYSPKVELIAKDNKFYLGLICEIFQNLFVRTHRYQFQSFFRVLCFKQIPKYQPVERYRAIMALLFLYEGADNIVGKRCKIQMEAITFLPTRYLKAFSLKFV